MRVEEKKSEKMRIGPWFIFGFCILFIAQSISLGDVRIAGIFGDGMVLQQQAAVPIWGQASPFEEIQIKASWEGATVHSKADKQGKWTAKLKTPSAGGPYTICIKAKNEIVLNDVLVGEVWFGSGQSNMWMPLKPSEWTPGAVNHEKEIREANYPRMRLFEVPQKSSGVSVDDIEGRWHVCKPDTAGDFSATAYFFGREIHKQLDVPVGLITASWGRTFIEPWTSEQGFAAVAELRDIYQKVRQANIEYADAMTLARQENRPLPEHLLKDNWKPTSLFNAMIYPVTPFAIRGVIWYQGESNCTQDDKMLYYHKMKALIQGWRQAWNRDDLPFYFVQLAPFAYTKQDWGKKMTTEYLSEIWNAQRTALSLPHTGMVVTTDITDINDIHPPNKQDVGKRLALIALAKVYGQQKLVYSGPLYRSMSIEANKVRLYFDHVGSGLASRDGHALTWFEIAGEDGRFVKANAEIDVNTVIVSNPKVLNPIVVRFAWHEQATPNLINKEGLPASPFRTN